MKTKSGRLGILVVGGIGPKWQFKICAIAIAIYEKRGIYERCRKQ